MIALSHLCLVHIGFLASAFHMPLSSSLVRSCLEQRFNWASYRVTNLYCCRLANIYCCSLANIYCCRLANIYCCRLANIYWFTVEFGLLKSRCGDEVKVTACVSKTTAELASQQNTDTYHLHANQLQ